MCLTNTGKQFYRIGTNKRSVVPDLFHFLHFSLWRPDKPLQNSPSWSYRTYCEMLFERGDCTLDLPSREALTAELNNAILDFFGYKLAQTKKGSVSLSTNSLTGIYHWLKALNPPAIVEEKFLGGLFCSPELLLMAISLMSTNADINLDVDILLTPINRLEICRICLLQPEVLDGVLDWTISNYPLVIQPGTRTGSYGRFVRLLKQPQWEDLLSEVEQ